MVNSFLKKLVFGSTEMMLFQQYFIHGKGKETKLCHLNQSSEGQGSAAMSSAGAAVFGITMATTEICVGSFKKLWLTFH